MGVRVCEMAESLYSELQGCFNNEDYEGASSLIRITRTFLNRNKEQCKDIPMILLLDLLGQTNHEETINELCSLIELAVNENDPTSIYTLFGVKIEEALQSDRLVIVKLALRIAERVLRGEDLVKSASSLIKAIVTLLSHSNVEVSNMVIDVLANPNIEYDLFESTLEDKRDGVVEFRYLRILTLRNEMINRIPSKWIRIISNLIEGRKHDPLAFRIAIEEIKECSLQVTSTQVDPLLDCLLDSGILETLAGIARSEEEDECGCAIDCFSSIFALPHEKLNQIEMILGLSTIIKSLLAHSSTLIKCSVVFLLSVLTINEKLTAQWITEDFTLQLIVEGFYHSSGEFNEAIISSFSNIFSAKARASSLIYSSLKSSSKVNPLEFLFKHRITSPNDTLKNISYDLVEAICTYNDIITDAALSFDFFGWLLDRSNDDTVIGRMRKYNIIRQIINLPWSGLSTRDTLAKQLNDYIQRGVVAPKGSIAIVESLNR